MFNNKGGPVISNIHKAALLATTANQVHRQITQICISALCEVYFDNMHLYLNRGEKIVFDV